MGAAASLQSLESSMGKEAGTLAQALDKFNGTERGPRLQRVVELLTEAKPVASEGEEAVEKARNLVQNTEAIDLKSAPSVDLLSALLTVGCPVPCELAGPTKPSMYHANVKGELRGFATTDNHNTWMQEKRAAAPTSFADVNPLQHDADFCLQYLAGSSNGQSIADLRGLCDKLRDEHEKQYAEAVTHVQEAEADAFAELMKIKCHAPEGGKWRQPSHCADTISLYAGALASVPALYALGEDVSAGHATSIQWSVKKPDRFFKKALQKYANDVTKVTDVARISLVFETVQHIVDAVKRLLDPYHAIVFKNRFVQQADGGYCDVLTQVRLPDQICEVQLHLKPIYDLKSEGGHHVYKWFRRFGVVGQTGPVDEQGLLHGEGSMSMPNGDTQSGTFVHGVLRGTGRYLFADGDEIKGEFQDGDVCDGWLTQANGAVYHGRLVGSTFEGEGTLTSLDGSVKQGTFSKNRLVKGMYKRGTARRASFAGASAADMAASKSRDPLDGATLETKGDGSFNEYCMLTGEGKIRLAGGRILEGTFRNNMLNGDDCSERWRGKSAGGPFDSDAPMFERSGTYENNSLIRGKFVQPGQGAFEGEFKNGQPHGKNTARMENGMVIDGEWKEGKPWNCEITVNGKIVRVFKDGVQSAPPADA